MPADIPVAIHTKPYPAISPSRPELSQAGRNVLILGGSTGIGYAIARGFCAAGASKVIITGRRSDLLSESVSKLAAAYPKATVFGQVSDMRKILEAKALWDCLENQENFTTIDVLVLNAVNWPSMEPILVQGTERLWECFEANIHAPLYHVERFYKQPGPEKQKFCLFVSTWGVHDWHSPKMPGYDLTKSSFTATMQQIAQDIPAEKMQILSFHPGVVLTEVAKKIGMTEDMLSWDDENLPGQFAVWAASSEAEFLHGRFVWATMDVNEMASGEMRKKIDSDPLYLKVGVKGF